MYKIVRLFRILFENLFIDYKNYDKNVLFDTNDTLMSFNIRSDHPKDNETNWVHRRDAILKMILEKKPAIICMQEVQPHMYKWLHKRLANVYNFVGVVGCKKFNYLQNSIRYLGNGLLIMYDKNKFGGCIENIIWAGYAPEKFILKCKLFSNTTKYVIMNTHYSVDDIKHRQRLTELVNYDISTEMSIDDEYIFYYCGDFNTTRNAFEIKNINLNHTIPVDDSKRTFNHFDDTHAVIDFIHSNIDIDSYAIVDDDYGVPYISDHYPIEIPLKVL